jgi:ligand-binding sensor domain-containing protein
MDDKRSLVKQPRGLAPQSELRTLLNRFLREGEDDPFTWDSFTVENGLPNNWIYDLFQDSKGNIWVGTWGGGLARFDGKTWTALTTRDGLASNAVTCFAEDKDGRIWIATDGGLNVFDGKTVKDAGLTGKSLLNIIADRRGRIWAGCWRMHSSGGGLFRFDGTSWKSFGHADGMPGMEILKVFEDSRGWIWVGTYEFGRGAGVGCYDGASWRSYSRPDGLIDDCVYSMFEDPDANMWFGTVGGVSVFDPKKRKWYPLSTLDGLVNDRVYGMAIDSRQKMWFGTEGGVSRYDGTNWKSFTKEDGLVENLVRAILEDRDGNIWFGTYPYAPGHGGISVARYAKGAKALAERLSKYLPESLKGKVLEPHKKTPNAEAPPKNQRNCRCQEVPAPMASRRDQGGD